MHSFWGGSHLMNFSIGGGLLNKFFKEYHSIIILFVAHAIFLKCDFFHAYWTEFSY
jgi:hypothetical protein